MKKKSEKNPGIDKQPQLTGAQYWEWRTTIEELKSARLSDEVTKLRRDLMERDIETKKLRLALFKGTLEASNKALLGAKNEYDRHKKELEEQLGCSLDGCVISDVDFSVQKLD